MHKYKCTPNIVIYSSLINGFSEQDRVEDALDLLRRIPCEPDTICYSAALKGLCRAKRWDDARELIDEMIRKQWPPDEATFSMLNGSLCQNGLVDMATEVFEQMSEYGCSPNSTICSCLVNSYSQLRADEALKLSNSMP
jgi:leucine-rich PPR motif-containing protein